MTAHLTPPAGLIELLERPLHAPVVDRRRDVRTAARVRAATIEIPTFLLKPWCDYCSRTFEPSQMGAADAHGVARCRTCEEQHAADHYAEEHQTDGQWQEEAGMTDYDACDYCGRFCTGAKLLHFPHRRIGRQRECVACREANPPVGLMEYIGGNHAR